MERARRIMAAQDQLQYGHRDRCVSIVKERPSVAKRNVDIAPLHAPIANISANHWDQTYSAWQNRLRFEQERAKAVESHQLRVFGGEPGDEVSLFEPMMKVVTDLFDGYDDFGYP
ncbi:hypothetical protein OPT61_g2375 [Boeremia exigua]|uniref:Uncharacterized protein n=1 Tax=Boeremia exigua TaxID=749465 RepID=A0ACC2ILR3_9PLEO|nr:hypothetical protein OPT61_g2375 [Boeremia exigua]